MRKYHLLYIVSLMNLCERQIPKIPKDVFLPLLYMLETYSSPPHLYDNQHLCKAKYHHIPFVVSIEVKSGVSKSNIQTLALPVLIDPQPLAGKRQIDFFPYYIRHDKTNQSPQPELSNEIKKTNNWNYQMSIKISDPY